MTFPQISPKPNHVYNHCCHNISVVNEVTDSDSEFVVSFVSSQMNQQVFLFSPFP